MLVIRDFGARGRTMDIMVVKIQMEGFLVVYVEEEAHVLSNEHRLSVCVGSINSIDRGCRVDWPVVRV